MEWIVNSEPSLHKLLGDLREQFRQHKYLKVKAPTGKKRTLDQNAILRAWHTQMALALDFHQFAASHIPHNAPELES